jgi:hypothetical protein
MRVAIENIFTSEWSYYEEALTRRLLVLMWKRISYLMFYKVIIKIRKKCTNKAIEN